MTVTREGRRDLVWGALLVLISAVVIAPEFVAAGNVFDEGILLTFPSRVNQGSLPYRDFETFYGPGGPYLLAGAFDVFGASLGTERAVGFFFRLLLIAAIYWLLLRWGRRAALGGGLIALVIVAQSASFGNYPVALAFTVLALALASRTVRRGWGGFAAAGFLAGLAGLFRVEAGFETLVALVPLAVGASRRRIVALLAGFVVALSPYLPLALAASLDKVEKVEHDLSATGAARRLPITIGGASGYLFILMIAALAVIAAAVVVSLRARAPDSRLLLSIWILAALQVPFALWLFDAGHVSYAAIMAFAAVPAATLVLAERLPTTVVPRAIAGRLALVAPAAAGVMLLFLAGSSFVRYNVRVDEALARGRERSYLISYRGRDFRLSTPQLAHELASAIETVGRLEPRGGSLFVGPSDLRRTDGNDPFVYYMLPWLRPASFYIEMDPPVSQPGSGLASAVAHANVLILASQYNTPPPGQQNGALRLERPKRDRQARVLPPGHLRHLRGAHAVSVISGLPL